MRASFMLTAKTWIKNPDALLNFLNAWETSLNILNQLHPA